MFGCVQRLVREPTEEGGVMGGRGNVNQKDDVGVAEHVGS